MSPHTDIIQKPNNIPHKPALNTCRSSCQQISTPNHMLLKADPRLEDDIADDKADPLVCAQLNQISVLQYFFLEKACSMDHQHMLRQTVFFVKKFLPQWLHCSGMPEQCNHCGKNFFTKKTVCLSMCWWSMEQAFSKKKYCKTDIWLSCAHTKGSALSSAISSSRRGSALRSI